MVNGNSEASGSSSSSNEIACHACGFESSFVPEGMIPCERCQAAHYCSLHCLQWDWNSGGHAKTCVDIRSAEPDLESEHTASNHTDDATLASMGMRDVFSHGSSDHSSKTNPKQQTGTGSNSTSIKDRQQLWEEKIKASTGASTTVPDKQQQQSSSGSGSGGAKLGAFIEEHSPPKGSRQNPALKNKKQVLHQAGGQPPVNPYQGRVSDDEDEVMEEDSLDMMSAANTEASELQSILEEQGSQASEPTAEGSWRSKERFDDGSAASSSAASPASNSKRSVQVHSVLSSNYANQEEDASIEMLADEEGSIEMYQDEDSEASGGEERGIFAETGAEKRDALAMSSSASSPDSSSSVKRMKEVMNKSASNSPVRILAPPAINRVNPPAEEAEAADMQEVLGSSTKNLKDFREEYKSDAPKENVDSNGGTMDTKHLQAFRDIVSPPAIECVSPPAEEIVPVAAATQEVSGFSAQNLKLFRNEYKNDTPNNNVDGNGGTKDAKHLKAFRNIYGSEDTFQTTVIARMEKDDSKHLRRATMGNGTDGPPKQKARRRMSLEDKLERISREETINEESESQEALQVSVDRAIREFEDLYGYEAAQAAMAQLTEGVTREHDQQNSGKRHQSTMENSSWGPATITAGISDSASNSDSFANASFGSASISTYPFSGISGAQEPTILESQISSQASADSEEEDRLLMPGGNIAAAIDAPAGAGTGQVDESSRNDKGNNILRAVAGVAAVAAVTGGVVATTRSSGGNTDVVSISPPSAGSNATAVNSSTSGTSSMPRYMQYRSSLASSTTSQPIVAESSEPEAGVATEDDSEEEGQEALNSRGLATAAVGRAAVAGAVTAGVMAGGSNTGTPAFAPSSSSMPRYMQYRSSLAQSTTPSQIPASGLISEEEEGTSDGTDGSSYTGASASIDDDSDEPGSAEGVVSVASDLAPNSSPMPRYMQYRSSLASSTTPQPILESKAEVATEDDSEEEEQEASNSRRLAAAAVGTAAMAGVVTAGVMTGGSNSGSPAPSSTPRYMQYRSSLASSTTSQSVAPASSEANEEEEESTSNSRGLAAAAVGTAVVAGAVAAGVMAGGSNSGISASSSTPRYMQYRSSLAQSTTPNQIPVSELIAEEEGATKSAEGSSFIRASASTDDDSYESSSSEAQTEQETVMARNLDYQASSAARNESELAEVTSSKEETIQGDADESNSENAARIGVGVAAGAATGVAVAAIASSGEAGAQVESSEEIMERMLAYQASIAKPKGRSESYQLAEEARATKVAAALGKSVTGDEPASEMARQPRAEDASLSSDEEGGDPQQAGDGSDSYDDIETGRAKDSPPAYSDTSTLCTRRRMECLALLLVILGIIGLGAGLGTARASNDDAVDAPAMSPTLAAAFAPTRSPIEAPVTAATLTPSRSPIEAPVTEIPTSSPAVFVEMTPAPVIPVAPTSSPTTPNFTAAPSAVPVTDIPTISPTGPTPAPVLVDQELFDLLSGVSFDNGDSILTQGTPQNLAYEWLANTTSLGSLPEERQIQKYALATLYYGTGGDAWTNNAAWLSEANECTWYSMSSQRPNCNELDEYVDLDLGVNGVSGSLPPEVALLSGLTRLELSGDTVTSLAGTIPSELGLLTSLVSFRAARNSLSGALSSEFGAWTALEVLDLSENRISGSLPAEMGTMIALGELELTTNRISGELPTTLGQLTNLLRMSLADNAISGSVPGQFGQLTLLRFLRLETNAFTSIPTEFGDLDSLQSLTMSENSVAGTLHTELGSLSNLRTLELRSNDFTGIIPPQFGLLTNLRDLDLSSNALTGLIPPDIGLMLRLFSLQLQSNRLSGNIPVEFGLLERLSEVRVDENDLTGAVPDAVCDVFSSTLPTFYLDCGGQPPQVVCPPGTCCTYCCEDGVGCECVYAGTGFAFLC